MNAVSYLLKIQINHIVLDAQTCPGIPKEAFETYISQNYWSSKVKGSSENMKIKTKYKAWKCEIDIAKPGNIERYTTTKIYSFISTTSANHVMLI